MSTIQETVEAIKQKDIDNAEAELQRVTDLLGLPDLARQAEERMNAIAARATEFHNTIKDTTISATDRELLLAKRPGLALWFEKVAEAQADVRGITVDKQSILARALERYRRLTPADTLPRVEDQGFMVRTILFGEISRYIYRGIYEALGNNRPSDADIDAKIQQLKDRFAELQERLNSVAS